MFQLLQQQQGGGGALQHPGQQAVTGYLPMGRVELSPACAEQLKGNGIWSSGVVASGADATCTATSQVLGAAFRPLGIFSLVYHRSLTATNSHNGRAKQSTPSPGHITGHRECRGDPLSQAGPSRPCSRSWKLADFAIVVSPADFDLVYKRLQNAAAEKLSVKLAASNSSDVKGTTGSTQARCNTPRGYHVHMLVLADTRAEPRHATGHFPQGAWKYHDAAMLPKPSTATPAASCKDPAPPAPSPASLARGGFVWLQLSRLSWAWQYAEISSRSCEKALAELYHQEQKHRAACEVLNDKLARMELHQRPQVASNAEEEVIALQARLATCSQEALASSLKSAAQIEQLGVALQQARKEAAKLQAEKLADQQVIVDQEVELQQQRTRADQAEARLRAVEAASQSKLFCWLGSVPSGSGGSTSPSSTNLRSASKGQGAGNQGSSKGEQGKQAQGPIQPHPHSAPALLQLRYDQVVRKLVALRAVAAVREPACQAAEAEVLRLQQALAAAEARTLLQVECGREQRLLLEAELQVLRAKAEQAEAQLQQLAATKQPPAHRQGCGSTPCPSTGRTSPCSGSLSGCSDDGLDICSEWGSDEERTQFKGRDQAPSPMPLAAAHAGTGGPGPKGCKLQGAVQQLKRTLLVVASRLELSPACGEQLKGNGIWSSGVVASGADATCTATSQVLGAAFRPLGIFSLVYHRSLTATNSHNGRAKQSTPSPGHITGHRECRGDPLSQAGPSRPCSRCNTPRGYHVHMLVLADTRAEPRHATGHFPQGAWKYHDAAMLPKPSTATPAASCKDPAPPAPSPASLARGGFVWLQLSRLSWAWQYAEISSRSCEKALAELYHQEQKHRAACEVLNDKLARMELHQRPQVASNAEEEVIALQARLATCSQEALASSLKSAAQIEQLGVALQQARKEAAKLQAEKLADQQVIVDQEVELQQQRARAEQAEGRLRAVEAASQSKLFRWLGSVPSGSGGSTSPNNNNLSSASKGQGAGNQGSSKWEQGKQAQGPIQPPPPSAPVLLQLRYDQVVRKLVALRAVAAVREPACQAAEAEVLRLQQALAAAEARTLLQVECGREQRLLLEAELQVLRAKAEQAEAQLQQLAAMKQPPAHRQGCGSTPCPSTGRTSPCSGSLSGCSDDGLDICSEWGSDEERTQFKGRDQAPSPMPLAAAHAGKEGPGHQGCKLQGAVQQLKRTLLVVASR
ncbi:hypothetical protein QJQ45_013929 [Haematococcus lacustris]|nr:hypothetical protein QJQ45_013929 [Haematococcus lacustris]